MCTAVTYSAKDHYFGRTFDWEVSYGEKLVFTPRNYPFHFRKMPVMENHYALLGIAVVAADYPLYYDAINEAGLGMAGLNFPVNTDYKEFREDKDNVTPFEFIPWILGQCATVQEAKKLLARINLLDLSFSEQFPLSPLHWIIVDKTQAITVECVKDGLKIYDNPVGVLTNNPPFDMQMFHLGNFRQLTNRDDTLPGAPGEPEGFAAAKSGLLSRGMGALGLPGDWSSISRFVRTAFVKTNSVPAETEEENVTQFFRILGTAEVPMGCVELEPDVYEISIYTSCCNLDKGMYYYKTYGNSGVGCVDMHREDLAGKSLKMYRMNRILKFRYEN